MIQKLKPKGVSGQVLIPLAATFVTAQSLISAELIDGFCCAG